MAESNDIRKQFKKARAAITNHRHGRFVDILLSDATISNTQAYKDAGYKANKSAEVRASELVRNSKIAKALKLGREAESDKYKDKKERLIAELEKLVYSNIGDYLEFDSGGVAIKNSKDLSPELLAAISEVSEIVTDKGGSLKFKLHDKKGSIELLMKHLRMLDTKSTIDVPDGATLVITKHGGG